MNSTMDIKNLVTALLAAQAEIQQPKKNSVNPHFKSKFADLGECFDCVREPLRKHGLIVSQLVDGHFLTTMLMHSSGQYIASQHPLPAEGTPQQLGSAITYARRYALCAMLGLVAEVDDDANAASEAASAKIAADRAAFLAKTQGGGK